MNAEPRAPAEPAGGPVPPAPDRLAEAELRPRRAEAYPSPRTWRDQILYFLLPDRFSDGRESERPAFDRADPGRHAVTDHARWQVAGRGFQGGTLRGILGRLGYLAGLGVTALWIGPVWRQRADLDTYHGYGIAHFLDVDERFGTRQDLCDLVDAAHDRGMYVLLDVIYNHSGNNWFYDAGGAPADEVGYRYAPPHPVHGWRSAAGSSIPPDAIAGTGDAVWPVEFQDLGWYTRAGRIGRWDSAPWEHPLHPDNEYRRGDFYSLKNLELPRDDVLSALIRVYQHWIALTDCDGFRIDTVKHVSWEASRNFCGAIHEYAESIGKDNFLLLGEVTGGSGMARDYLEIFGRNIDAALDIGDPARRLVDLAKGFGSPAAFFDLYRDHDVLGSHRETGRYHVSILDDHDMVGRDKRRFAAGNDLPARYEQVAHAVGVQLTTLGIPCIYSGTEQALDGSEERHDPAVDGGHEDRYIRETMFGGSFGPFHTHGCHVFDPDHPTYLRIAALARLRRRDDGVGLALRRGRVYPRETAPPGEGFSYPGAGGLVAWSRILFDREVLVALNTSGVEGRAARVTVDAGLHPPGSALTVLYRSDWDDAALRGDPPFQVADVSGEDGRSVAQVDLPPAGMCVLG